MRSGRKVPRACGYIFFRSRPHGWIGSKVTPLSEGCRRPYPCSIPDTPAPRYRRKASYAVPIPSASPIQKSPLPILLIIPKSSPSYAPLTQFSNYLLASSHPFSHLHSPHLSSSTCASANSGWQQVYELDFTCLFPQKPYPLSALASTQSPLVFEHCRGSNGDN